MTWTKDAPYKPECVKIRWEIVPYTRGVGLDVGCGSHKPFEHFIGVDNRNDEQMFHIKMKPDVWVLDACTMPIFGSQAMDFVFSSHLLEHIHDHRKALREWWRVLKPGGYLVLYLPHKDHYPHMGDDGANPDHKHDFHPDDIIEAMQEVPGGWDLVENQVRTEDDEYSFFQVYQRALSGKEHLQSWKNPKPTQPTAAVVRYGAFGDYMQTSSVIAELKEQGFHVTLHGSPPASDVMRADPHIDRVILQDKDQVPNQLLGPFWDYWSKKYDRFVNLSESVERSMLAIHPSAAFLWKPKARHELLNHNYIEMMHHIAGVPFTKNKIRFYAEPAEKEWARKERAKMDRYVIVWALAGSSVHKTWPYVDAVIASLMLNYPEVDVVFVGGPEGKILEAGWENEKRVHCRSGEWEIRKTLAFLDVADCIIGPETGVLNAAAMLDIPKIVFLSHSTHENLTKGWYNTYPLWAKNINCKGRGNNEAPACHQLHYSWDHCNKDYDPECLDCKDNKCTKHTHTAVCQAAIGADEVCAILHKVISEVLEVEAA